MISKEEVEKIAKLSRIRLDETMIEKFQKDFSDILNYVGLLKNAKMPKSKIDGGVKNVLREDKVISDNPERVEILIGLAPEKENRHIKVKAVFLNE